jgi:signal transduction histidine kinase
VADPVAVDVRRPLGRLVRLATDLRLILLLVAMVAALVAGADRLLLGLLLVASYAGVGLLLWWDRVAAVLLRHPVLFLVDVGVTVGIVALTGVDGPFVLYTIGTAFLAGVLYGYVGGLLFGGALAVAQVGVAAQTAPASMAFTAVVGIPALILIAGVGAAAIRGLVVHAAGVEAELDVAVGQAAAAEERARLAREMHDTVGKTLHGIALTAATLPRWIEVRPEEAARRAGEVAAAAETAAGEARQLISDLRSDRLDQPLHATVTAWAQEWARETGLDVALAVAPIGTMSASARYELFTILRESLRNVAAHAAATRASVYLAQDGGTAVLEVADDGRGLACTDLEQLAADGHYGLVGMQERARRAGGRVLVRSRGRGTTVRAEIPMTSAHDMVPAGAAGEGSTA